MNNHESITMQSNRGRHKTATYMLHIMMSHAVWRQYTRRRKLTSVCCHLAAAAVRHFEGTAGGMRPEASWLTRYCRQA